MMRVRNLNYFANMMQKKPYAQATISGQTVSPINGQVNFYPAYQGTLVVAEIYGLPQETVGNPPVGPLGFHIHEGGACEVTSPSEPFKSAGDHYNPTQQPHPMHAGDMPVLFGNKGYAFLAFYTDRFSPQQVVGKTVIIHQSPDDFRTQPAGNSGKRLACGVIMKA